jgi:hypothetical protein
MALRLRIDAVRRFIGRFHVHDEPVGVEATRRPRPAPEKRRPLRGVGRHAYHHPPALEGKLATVFVARETIGRSLETRPLAQRESAGSDLIPKKLARAPMTFRGHTICRSAAFRVDPRWRPRSPPGRLLTKLSGRFPAPPPRPRVRGRSGLTCGPDDVDSAPEQRVLVW